MLLRCLIMQVNAAVSPSAGGDKLETFGKNQCHPTSFSGPSVIKKRLFKALMANSVIYCQANGVPS